MPPLPPSVKSIFSSFFGGFPRKDAVDELKKKGKLNEKTLVEIEGEDFFRVWYWRRISRKIPPGPNPLLCFGLVVIGLIGGVIAAALLHDFFWIWIGFQCGLFLMISSLLVNPPMGCEILGHLDKSPILIEFLDEFAVSWWNRQTRNIVRILTFGRKVIPITRWEIEYGILLTAYQWHQRDPRGFAEAVKKAKNKKEFLIAMGVS